MPQPTAAALAYRRIFDSRSAEEIHLLARIKRFLEVWSGDGEFRTRLREAAEAGGPLDALCAEHGIDSAVDPVDMLPLLDPEHAALALRTGRTAFPQAELWQRYINEMLRQRDLIRESGWSGAQNPRFDHWRRRQIARCNGELGASARSIVHPAIAFELSEGCSVGCWFCGISAAKFRGHFPYAPNQALWRGVLQATVEFFGPAAATGFCYWATDPADNPDYPDFIEDFYHATGALPQTTTAAPLKNVALTRRVLALHGRYRTVTNRFSILNRKLMRRVHDTFTADELMGVELVIQSRESVLHKAKAGRARSRDAAGEPAPVDHSTIACVTGFLVNMPLGRVQLVTPTRAGETWPDGYWVLGERRFEDAAGFAAALQDLADAHMTQDIGPRDVLAARPDLHIELLEDGFELVGSAGTRCVTASFGRQLGELLAAGSLPVGAVHAELGRAGANPFEVARLLDEMFAAGLLCEDPRRPGIHGAHAPERAAA